MAERMFKKIYDHPVHTIPNHHPTKRMFSEKNSFKSSSPVKYAPQSNHSDDLSLLFCLYPSSSMPLWYIQQTITVMHSGGWCGLPGSGQHGGFFLQILQGAGAYLGGGGAGAYLGAGTQGLASGQMGVPSYCKQSGGGSIKAIPGPGYSS